MTPLLRDAWKQVSPNPGTHVCTTLSSADFKLLELCKTLQMPPRTSCPLHDGSSELVALRRQQALFTKRCAHPAKDWLGTPCQAARG
eukprot:4656865-Amphidinium_carterae.2